MNAKKSIRAATLLLLCFSLADAAYAESQTITFNVPVKLQNIHPDITKPLIDCTLVAKDGGTITHALKYIPISGGGNFTGPIQVAVTASQGEVDIAVGWYCQLWLYPQAGTGYEPKPQGSGLPLQQAKAGTPLVYKVEGKF